MHHKSDFLHANDAIIVQDEGKKSSLSVFWSSKKCIEMNMEGALKKKMDASEDLSMTLHILLM